MSRRSSKDTIGRRIATLVLGFAIVTSVMVAGIAGGVGAQAAAGGEPELEVFTEDPILTPGTSSKLVLQVANDAEANFGSISERDRVTAARNVRVEVDADGTPIEVESGTYSVGTISENQPRDVPIAVDIPEDAEPGEYEVDVELEYSYTSGLFPRGEVEHERTKTVTRTIEVEIDDSPRFELRGIDDMPVQVGETGSVGIKVTNIGAERASDVAVTLESQSGMLRFGEAARDTARVDELETGETETITYEVSVVPDAPNREYGLDGTVRYTDSDGIRGHDGDLSVGVSTVGEQAFSVTATDTTLHADEEGDVAVTVANEGPTTAHDVAIGLDRQFPNVRLLEGAVSVGTLEPGESKTTEVPFSLSRNADPVSKRLGLALGYRTADGEARVDTDHSLVIDIQERRDDFSVSLTDTTITADSSRLVEVEVTNNRDQRLTDIEAKLGTSDPLNSDDDEGYVSALDPGETTTMTFELSATSDANPKTYSVEMDFRYDDQKDKTKMSNTYRIPVEVEQDSGLPLWIFAVGLLAVVSVGGLLYYRVRSGGRPGN